MTQMIPAYVINMARAAHRLAFVTDRFDSLGVGFTRIDAVDGAALSEAERVEFIRQRPRDGKRGWRPGQIGCLMSHRRAWQNIAEGEASYGLVLEDDIHVSSDLPAFVGSTDWIPQQADVVRLESTGQWLSLGPTLVEHAGRRIRQIRSSAWGAGAYILSQDTARRLVNGDPRYESPADDYLFNRATSRVAESLCTLQVVPALAEQDKFSASQETVIGFGSDIETDQVNQRLRGFSAWRRRVTSTLRGKTPVEFA